MSVCLFFCLLCALVRQVEWSKEGGGAKVERNGQQMVRGGKGLQVVEGGGGQNPDGPKSHYTIYTNMRHVIDSYIQN